MIVRAPSKPYDVNIGVTMLALAAFSDRWQ